LPGDTEQLGLGLSPPSPRRELRHVDLLRGSVWVRLGSRKSWQGEDMDANMIKPVEP